MSTKITLMSSEEHTSTVRIHSPIDGDEKVKKDTLQKSLSRFSITTAHVDCEGSPLESGEVCSVYGESGSGTCILVGKNVVANGGGTGVPYLEETLSFMGL